MLAHPGAPCPPLDNERHLQAVKERSILRGEAKHLECFNRWLELRPAGSHNLELIPRDVLKPEVPKRPRRAKCLDCGRCTFLHMLHFTPCASASAACTVKAIRNSWELASKEIAAKWREEKRTRHPIRSRLHPHAGERIGEASHPGP